MYYVVADPVGTPQCTYVIQVVWAMVSTAFATPCCCHASTVLTCSSAGSILSSYLPNQSLARNKNFYKIRLFKELFDGIIKRIFSVICGVVSVWLRRLLNASLWYLGRPPYDHCDHRETSSWIKVRVILLRLSKSNRTYNAACALECSWSCDVERSTYAPRTVVRLTRNFHAVGE